MDNRQSRQVIFLPSLADIVKMEMVLVCHMISQDHVTKGWSNIIV